MLVSSLVAGIEKARQLASLRIDSCEICAFEQIAALASPRQIRRNVRARMLLRYDVIGVEGPKRKIVLVKTAIFTASAGAVANQSAETRGHYAAKRSER